MKKGYTGWYLPIKERNQLLKLFPPRYEHVVAHHVTEHFGVYEDHELPRQTKGRIIGMIDDGRGIQALIIDMDGLTGNTGGFIKPNGSWYHITWSHAKGRKPVESNDYCKDPFVENFIGDMIQLEPRFFPFD